MIDPNSALRDISVAELNDLIGNHEDLLIVDVREREEYARGHIAGALIVPAGTLEHAADATSVACNDQLVLGRTGTVVVYCDDGRRGRMASAQLDRLGFPTVYCLAGGLKSWRNEGLPVVRD
jgi:rhodanese-related sulfurtransferase